MSLPAAAAERRNICNGKGMTMTNQKYEITGIAHESYPFLHRIRALRDIGWKIKAGDMGGFVECEANLSFEPGDNAWIFDDAIACVSSHVDKGSRLFGNAVVCGNAYISHGSTLSDQVRAEDDAYIRGADLSGQVRASGSSTILDSPDTGKAPVLSETCVVYGTVMGDIHITGDVVVLDGEKIINQTPDTLVMNGQGRSMIRDPLRDDLHPRQPAAQKKRTRKKEMER